MIQPTVKPLSRTGYKNKEQQCWLSDARRMWDGWFKEDSDYALTYFEVRAKC